MTREEVVSMLKRNSTGFSRGRSKFRGVTRASSVPAPHCLPTSQTSWLKTLQN